MSQKGYFSGLILGCSAEWVLVLLLTRHGDFFALGEAEKFTFLGFMAGLAYWLAARCFLNVQIPAGRSAAIFWGVALVLRFAVLFIEPGDDVWRYRWEGMIQLHGFNPYSLSPDAPALVYLRDADWFHINHRDYAAIYPPLTQAVFAILAMLGNSVWLYRAVFGFADLATCEILRRLLMRSGLEARQAVWYAWNPLVIYAFAGAVHFDSLMIVTLTAAVWCLDKYTSPDAAPTGNTGPALLWVSSALLGLAAGFKIVPLALLPLWMFAAGSWRRAFGVILLGVAPLALTVLAYGFPAVPVFATLQQFGRTFRVNDTLWSLLDLLTHAGPSVGNALSEICTFLACLGFAFWFRDDWRRGLLWICGVVVLLSPVIHAWYVVWVLPLAAWRGEGARPWFVLSISLFGYFLLWTVNHQSGRPWEEPFWLRASIYLPPVIAAASVFRAKTVVSQESSCL